MPRLETHIIELPDDIEAIVQTAITEFELPARLHDVLRAAMTGLDTKQTAVELELSVHTVKAYRASLCEKFGVGRVVEIVRRLLLRARQTA